MWPGKWKWSPVCGRPSSSVPGDRERERRFPLLHSDIKGGKIKLQEVLLMRHPDFLLSALEFLSLAGCWGDIFISGQGFQSRLIALLLVRFFLEVSRDWEEAEMSGLARFGKGKGKMKSSRPAGP